MSISSLLFYFKSKKNRSCKGFFHASSLLHIFGDCPVSLVELHQKQFIARLYKFNYSFISKLAPVKPDIIRTHSCGKRLHIKKLFIKIIYFQVYFIIFFRIKEIKKTFIIF